MEVRHILENAELSLDMEKCIEITKNLCDLFDVGASLKDLESPTMEALRFFLGSS